VPLRELQVKTYVGGGGVRKKVGKGHAPEWPGKAGYWSRRPLCCEARFIIDEPTTWCERGFDRVQVRVSSTFGKQVERIRDNCGVESLAHE
jgi:hypothetical protein